MISCLWHRDVAQLGSVLPWGGRGRRFKSCRSDHLLKIQGKNPVFFVKFYPYVGIVFFKVLMYSDKKGERKCQKNYKRLMTSLKK